MIRAVLYTDGGARGNPGPSGIGAFLIVGEKEYSYKEYIGVATSNQAEYKALILGMKKALEHGVQNLTVYMDSELIVNQLNEKYKVKDQKLAKLFVIVWNLKLRFKQISFTHIPRSQNKKADFLVNQAIDQNV